MKTLSAILGTSLLTAGLTFSASVLAPAAQAASFTYTNFSKLTNNNTENLTSQLGVGVTDTSGAYGVNLAANQVLFTFTNNVGIASNIAEVYIDDDSSSIGSAASLHNSLGGFTAFTLGSVNPGNLPSGNNANFFANVALSADTVSGGPANGINQSADILGIVYNLNSGKTIADIQNAFNGGTLRVGYHIRSIGTGGGSDSYVTATAVPEPVSSLVGFAGLAVVGLLKKRFA